MKFNTRLAHRTHLAATIAVMGSNAIRMIPNRVYVKQTVGLQSCLASPIYLPVAMKSDGSHYTCLKPKKPATRHPLYMSLLLTAHKLLGPINHLLLLLGVILVLLYKTRIRYIHGFLNGRPLFNALHPLLNVWHVINLDTCEEYSMVPSCDV